MKYLSILVLVTLLSACHKAEKVAVPPVIPKPVVLPENNAINIEADDLAKLILKSTSRCREAGIRKVEDCTASSDKTASSAAMEAKSATQSYLNKCLPHYSSDQCYKIVQLSTQKELREHPI